MYNADRVRANAAYYLSRGLCPRCGGNYPLEPGFKRCRPCAIKESTERKNRRMRNAANGRCPSCGHQRDDDKYKTCSRCRARSRAAFFKAKQQRMTTEV